MVVILKVTIFSMVANWKRETETLTVKCPLCNIGLVTEARTLADVNTT
jgi:hypothetical protein